MTIDEAIKYNKAIYDGLSKEMVETYGVALKLGIEALKTVLKAREGNYASFKLPLQGETKE